MRKQIHVNRHHIAANRKAQNSALPPYTVKTYKANIRGYRVVVHGEMELVYSPNKPLNCGAVAWLETHDTVRVLGKDGELVQEVV